jgi:4'-phosphopantetheinyl transferase
VAEVVWFSAGLAHVAGDDGWLDPVLADRLGRMRYTKRLVEARLGRWTAKQALARSLGLSTDPATLADVVVLNAPDGAPEAFVAGEPAGVVIAMTDRADWAVSAVLAGKARVGCDLEIVEPRSAAFVRDYFTPPEHSLVAAGDHDLMANLIWSAKESALKVLRTGLRRDTRSVVVRCDPATSDEPTAWRPLTVTAGDGPDMPGWWIRYGEFILTLCAAVATEPPRSLEDPPRLASAQPSHTWMDQPFVD